MPRTGSLRIDGARCTSLSWARFNLKKTIAQGGNKILGDLILNNVVSYTVLGPCTHRDVIEQIAQHSQTRIPIESLASDLGQQILPRGSVAYGFPGDYFDQIARNYDVMQWWVSKNGLNMEASADSGLSPFDELAGRLMFAARPRRENNRLPIEEYDKIARKLDRAGFKPVDHLEGTYRSSLAAWNQKYARKAIHTFREALSSRVPKLDLRRGVQRRLSRAESAWRQSRLSAR